MSERPDSELGTPKKNFDDTFSAETVLLEHIRSWMAVPEVKAALHRRPERTVNVGKKEE